MTKDEAIEYGKEQLDVFAAKHAEFIALIVEQTCVERMKDKWQNQK